MKTCYYCGEKYRTKNIFSLNDLCPYCGKDNNSETIEKLEKEKQNIEESKIYQNTLKQLFDTDEDVDISFEYICQISNSQLVYNKYTKIVYIAQAYTQLYSSYSKEQFCPFISPNGRYYKYLEEENRIVEL